VADTFQENVADKIPTSFNHRGRVALRRDEIGRRGKAHPAAKFLVSISCFRRRISRWKGLYIRSGGSILILQWQDLPYSRLRSCRPVKLKCDLR
jgi:hypothetical protein